MRRITLEELVLKKLDVLDSMFDRLVRSGKIKLHVFRGIGTACGMLEERFAGKGSESGNRLKRIDIS